MHRACLLPLMLLAACRGSEEAAVSPQPAEASSATPAAADTSAAPSLTPVDSLAGEWRVAGIDGQSLDEPYGIALRGNDRELWWEPRCAGMARRYRLAGTAIAFAPVEPEGQPLPSGSPPPPCAIGLPPRVADVMRALDAASSAGRTPANGVHIAGGGRSVTLFSQ